MKRLTIFLALFVLAVQINAQIAGKLTQIINTEEATYGQASYMTAVAVGMALETDSYETCFDILKDENLIAGNHSLKDSITAKNFADMLSKTWNINNSIFYRITKHPRYAFKQMKAAGVIPSNYYPNRILTGTEMLNIITLSLEKFNIDGRN
ncbi:MAG: hypothetical protein K6G00_03000 [Treponema sp.]|nr:hypothetical protein [Treponema sp.]